MRIDTTLLSSSVHDWRSSGCGIAIAQDSLFEGNASNCCQNEKGEKDEAKQNYVAGIDLIGRDCVDHSTDRGSRHAEGRKTTKRHFPIDGETDPRPFVRKGQGSATSAKGQRS